MNAIFEIREAKADCTVNTTDKIHLCGYANIKSAASVLMQGEMTCNRDPSLEVAVYQGSALLEVDIGAVPMTYSLDKGRSLVVDPATGKAMPGIAIPTTDQLAIFAAQADAMLTGYSFADTDSLLSAKSYLGSDWILAPDAFASTLPNYGKATAMCDFVNGYVAFYPPNPARPSISGAPCKGRTVIVRGVAIYEPQNLVFTGGRYFGDSGGTLVKSAAVSVTLQGIESSLIYSWDGSFGSNLPRILTTPGSKARADIYYVAHITYIVLPESAPHVALVAVSFGKATFPPH